MTLNRPPPDEQLNFGEPTTPRAAATVLLLRGGDTTLEVLLVQREPAARFMGGAWVFPGGAVDEHEGEGDPAHRLAAVREVEEETAIRLPDPAALVLLSRWVTPTQFKIRFDTFFFLAELPAGEQAQVDGVECVDFRWLAPLEALEAERSGELLLVLPTIRHLELLAGFHNAAEALGRARGRTVELVQPRIFGRGESARVVLPDEPGWDVP